MGYIATNQLSQSEERATSGPYEETCRWPWSVTAAGLSLKIWRIDIRSPGPDLAAMLSAKRESAMGRGSYLGGGTLIHGDGFGFTPLLDDGGYKPGLSRLTPNQVIAQAKIDKRLGAKKRKAKKRSGWGRAYLSPDNPGIRELETNRARVLSPNHGKPIPILRNVSAFRAALIGAIGARHAMDYLEGKYRARELSVDSPPPKRGILNLPCPSDFEPEYRIIRHSRFGKRQHA
jgi:hypothetical protein